MYRKSTTPKGNPGCELRWWNVRREPFARRTPSFARSSTTSRDGGGKRATVAVAHSILVAAYHVLRDGTAYRDLSPHHFDTLQRDRLTRYHVRRLRDLGYQLEPKLKA